MLLKNKNADVSAINVTIAKIKPVYFFYTE